MIHECEQKEIIAGLLKGQETFKTIFITKMDELNKSLTQFAVQQNELQHMISEIQELKNEHKEFKKEFDIVKNRGAIKFTNSMIAVIIAASSSLLATMVTYFLVK